MLWTVRRTFEETLESPLDCKGRKQWHPTPILLHGKSHGQRSLGGCSPWGSWGSDTTEHLHFHFSLSCIGEGNRNPLQCSCLENPRDRGAWWAATYGVAQSWTRLKRLSSSSSSIQQEKGATDDEMVGWHHWLSGHEFEQTPGNSEGQGSLACCSPWGHKELDMT